MIKKSILLLSFIMIFSIFGMFVAAQKCLEPYGGMRIDSDTELCTGQYLLDEGIIISSDDIVLSCNGASLIGSGNGNGITIEARKDVSITGCTIRDYQVGLFLSSALNISLLQSNISRNDVALSMARTRMSTIQGNIFMNNSGQGSDIAVYMDEESYGNRYIENTFIVSGFGFEAPAKDANGEIMNTYIDNDYAQDAKGPSGVYTSGKIYVPESRVVFLEPENITEEPDDGQGLDGVADDSQQATQIFDNPVSALFEIEDSGASQVSILQKIYDIRGIDDDKSFQKDIDEMKRLWEHVSIEKELSVDYERQETLVRTRLRSDIDISSLQVYEHIPKCFADDASKLSSEGHDVVDPDPLIVWEYEDIEKGQEIETTYSISKVFRRSPTTLAISGGSVDEAVCGEQENPVTLICSDCARKRNKYTLLMPLLLIPLIIVIFVYFGRFQQEPHP